MKFTELDASMRIYEELHDYCVLPNLYMVARLDGKGFTRLTKELHDFEAPFDERFKSYMTSTVAHLMNVGFNFIYGYTQSDEISLLFHLKDESFKRKSRKLLSVLAGEASAKFSLLLGDVACFDCRISELPRSQDVVDYFRWRNEDAFRNSLNAHCYWMLKKNGKTSQEATKNLEKMNTGAKNELLFANQINFNDLPLWQKRGIGIYWENYEKESVDQYTNQKNVSTRRQLKIDESLPMKDDYSQFIEELLRNNNS